MTAITKETILDEQAVVVYIKGALDDISSLDLEDYYLDLAAKNRVNILLDASGIISISSSGIGLFVSLMTKTKENNGLFVIFNLNDKIHSLFTALGVDKTLSMTANRAEAITMMENFLLNNASKNVDSEMYEKALHLKCNKCSAIVRVKAPGTYACPDCQSSFRATADMNIIFE